MKAKGLWIVYVWLMLCITGCGETTEEKIAFIDKAIQVAERHNLAYRVEIESTGRPSIGESIDLYLDTGLNARMIMFGNAASPDEPFEPEPFVREVETVETTESEVAP